MSCPTHDDRGGPSRQGRPPAAPVDISGRPLTTTDEAAAWYRAAQRNTGDMAATVTALQAALDTDPDFAVAAADLAALTGRGATGPAAGGLSPWERRHLDVVTGCRANSTRAAALLCEHAAGNGCDPVARLCVAAALGSAAAGWLPDAPPPRRGDRGLPP